MQAVGVDRIQVLIVDRGLIDGERMGHLKQAYHIDTIVPVRTNMDLYADALGLTRRRDFPWEPYVSPLAPLPTRGAPPKPLSLQKREAKRQQTLAARKAAAGTAPLPAAPPAAPAVSLPYTLLGLGRGLLSWTQCPVPWTAVVNREVDPHGETQNWVIVSTSDSFSAPLLRSTYELRTTIEERHRQYKWFWDLTQVYSCAFSLVVNQAILEPPFSAALAEAAWGCSKSSSAHCSQASQ